MAAKKKPLSQLGWGGAYGSGTLLPAPGATSGPAAPAKGVVRPATLAPPPVGTYDPGIDYNAQASQRGYNYNADDAQTAYEQGQEDYGLTSKNLLTTLGRTTNDLAQQETDVRHNYDVLGDQQAQNARRQGILSGGLAALSAQARATNETHDLNPIQTARERANEDYTTNKQALDLANARQFGGFNGNILNDPITGQPIAGSLLTSLTRGGAENAAYQGYSGGLRSSQAAQNGYIDPSLTATQPTQSLIDMYLKLRGQ